MRELFGDLSNNAGKSNTIRNIFKVKKKMRSPPKKTIAIKGDSEDLVNAGSRSSLNGGIKY